MKFQGRFARPIQRLVYPARIAGKERERCVRSTAYFVEIYPNQEFRLIGNDFIESCIRTQSKYKMKILLDT
uniref:Uncharacterized protein n=1 Tax=Trichogramma kaykai TaxID=54128 RepID=A0ABD2VYX4_9HYME